MSITKKEAAIISAYTGVQMTSFHEYQEYAQSLFKRSILSHEFGNKEIVKKLKELSRPDFLKLCKEVKGKSDITVTSE